MRKRIPKDLRLLSIDYLSGGRAVGMSRNGELLARRLIELLIKIDGHELPAGFDRLRNACGAGMTTPEFRLAMAEIRRPENGLFELLDGGNQIHCPGLTAHLRDRALISAQRREAGQKGGRATKTMRSKKQAPKFRPQPVHQAANEGATDSQIKFDLFDKIREDNR